jgi:hypothetical protein
MHFTFKGSDYLNGGPGLDILIGDIGYITRRFSDGIPVLQSETSETASANVWHKDIVLEELGNITQVARISTKVNTSAISALDTTSASLLFVANAIDENGGKYIDENGVWPTDLLFVDLVESYDDVLEDLEGSNVLIGL